MHLWLKFLHPPPTPLILARRTTHILRLGRSVSLKGVSTCRSPMQILIHTSADQTKTYGQNLKQEGRNITFRSRLLQFGHMWPLRKRKNITVFESISLGHTARMTGVPVLCQGLDPVAMCRSGRRGRSAPPSRKLLQGASRRRCAVRAATPSSRRPRRRLWRRTRERKRPVKEAQKKRRRMSTVKMSDCVVLLPGLAGTFLSALCPP